tara:strand:+ start:93 stop:1388 length:1296 start_codon:yes stop_codon:yes gene_type:complete
MKFGLFFFNRFLRKNLSTVFLVSLSLLTIIILISFNNLKELESKRYQNLLDNVYLDKTIKNIINNLNPKYEDIEHKVSKGDTFDKILKKYEVSTNEIKELRQILNKKNNINNLEVNQVIKFTIEKNKTIQIINFEFPISKKKKIFLTKNFESGDFAYEEIITNLEKKIVYKEGIIKRSLYRAATSKKIKPNIIIDFARIYGFQIDFQRDIRKNDTFQILYEEFVGDNDEVLETGNILFANINLGGKDNELYFFNNKNYEGHYDVQGKSAVKALMKTPINGARLSSSFGMRKHPILGYNKMHKGTDFAAPKGTPVMASGDGQIIKAAWCGGGGNCIKIKHNKTYSTVYAHLSKFATGIKKGTRVKQGRIIGYVGSTGLSTGPHLHYEVIENGKKINSQKLKLPSGKILKGDIRKKFEVDRIKTDIYISELLN